MAAPVDAAISLEHVEPGLWTSPVHIDRVMGDVVSLPPMSHIYLLRRMENIFLSLKRIKT